MEFDERFVLFTIIPFVYGRFEGARQSVAASRYFPIIFLVLNVAVFVYNVNFGLTREEYVMAKEKIRDQPEEEDLFYYDEHERDDGPSLMEQVEIARERQKWAAHIGSVPFLQPGVLLVWQDETLDDYWYKVVVLVTSHGGLESSLGFIVNSELPDEEAYQAREMLHEFNSASLTDGDERRQNLIRKAVQDDSRLWLGLGGPVGDKFEAWTHIHNCSGIEEAVELAPGVAWGGDISEILYTPNCFVKLMYGSAMWLPGQLDREVTAGKWKVQMATSRIVFDQNGDRHSTWSLVS